MDEYLATVPPEQRALLDRLRRTIRRAAPDAEECISYAMPAFRVKGGVLAGFARRGHGYSYYPFSGQTPSRDYTRTRSALHFSAARPLPDRLVRSLLEVRRAEMVSGTPGRKSARTRSRKPRGRAVP